MKPKLFFRWNDIMESFVFADEQQAIRTDQLHRTLFKAQTWEDLKIAVHPDDYLFLVSMYNEFAEDNGINEPSGEINWECIDTDSYSGGLYPAFLIYSMEDIIPHEILTKFGSDEIITDYDLYRQIKPGNLVPMITALSARGYDLAPAGDLIFDDFYTGS